VVAALQDTFGIRNDDVFQAATGLAAGGGACGAYSGGIMMISALRGRSRDGFGDHARVGENFALVQKLHDRFLLEYNSVLCRDVQTKVFGRPFYLIDPDEFRKFEKAGGHDIHCPEVVGKAARWAAEIIIAEGLI